MMIKILIISLILAFLLNKCNGLNPFTQYELPVNSSISCIKYVPGLKILAVALNTTGINFYNISGNSVVFINKITTSTRVNQMAAAVNNSRLIFAEDYKVSYIDSNAQNQTYSTMSTQFSQKIHQIFPNGTFIVVQTQISYSSYVCSLTASSGTSLTCTMISLPFSGLSTNFMKPNTHDDRQTAIAYNGQSRSMDIRIENTYNPYTVKSSITDIVYYSNIYQALIFTKTQSVYRTSVPLWGTTYQDCRYMDLNISVMKQSVIDKQEQVFFYITQLGEVKGRNVQDLKLAYYIQIGNCVELQRLQQNQDVVIRTGDGRLFFIWTVSYDNANTIFENLQLCPDESGIYPAATTTNSSSGTTSGTGTTNTTTPTTPTNTTDITNTMNTTTPTNTTDITNTTTPMNTTNTTDITNTTNTTNTTSTTIPTNATTTNSTSPSSLTNSTTSSTSTNTNTTSLQTNTTSVTNSTNTIPATTNTTNSTNTTNTTNTTNSTDTKNTTDIPSITPFNEGVPSTTNTTNTTTNNTNYNTTRNTTNDSGTTTTNNTTTNNNMTTNNTTNNNTTSNNTTTNNDTTNNDTINNETKQQPNIIVENKQIIFSCQLNCDICKDQLLCLKCKQGYQLTELGTCQTSKSIDLFSTIISTPYSGIVMKFVLMDFMEEFWFFEHHNFNYTRNIQRIFSLVGSLNRNKIVPPVFKYLIKDTVSNVNTRTISPSNFIHYTPVTFQKAQNTDAYFISNVSGMFIWAYALILFMYAFTHFGHSILSKIFGSDMLEKFSAKAILFYLLFSPFIQYISFHSFSQLRLFFSLNAADKVNLAITILFLGINIFFAFAGFPIFYYLNSVKISKIVYKQENSLKGYIRSLFLWSGKLFYLGFVNGYIQTFFIQCANLLVLYAIQIWLLKKQINVKQKNSLVRAPVFFKFIMKILSFIFVLCSIVLTSNIGQKSLFQPNQQISIVGIWTWALAQILFKVVEILLIGYKTLKSKIHSFFTKNNQKAKSQRSINTKVDRSQKSVRFSNKNKNTQIDICDMLHDQSFLQKTIKPVFGQQSQRLRKTKITKFKLRTKTKRNVHLTNQLVKNIQ